MDQRGLHTHADPCSEGPQPDRLVMHSFNTLLINSPKHFSHNIFFCNFSIFLAWGFAPIRFLLHVGRWLFPHVAILHQKSQDPIKAATDKYFGFGILGLYFFDPFFQIPKLKKNVGAQISKMGTSVCRGFDPVLRFSSKFCLMWSVTSPHMQ
jgi:hypothetical protein